MTAALESAAAMPVAFLQSTLSDVLEQFLFIHLVAVDVLIKVSENTSKCFSPVGIICLIIHKVLFLSIKKYISIYWKAIAVDTVGHFLKGWLYCLGWHRVSEMTLGPNGD